MGKKKDSHSLTPRGKRRSWGGGFNERGMTRSVHSKEQDMPREKFIFL